MSVASVAVWFVSLVASGQHGGCRLTHVDLWAVVPYGKARKASSRVDVGGLMEWLMGGPQRCIESSTGPGLKHLR